MTYGWAILVVMVVGVAMYNLGLFNMGVSPMSVSGFSKVKPQLSGTGIAADRNFRGIFTNGIGTQINVTRVFLSDSASASRCTMGGASNIVRAGENFLINSTTGDCLAATVRRGDSYSVTVSVEYIVSLDSITTFHNDSGMMRGAVE